MQEWPEASWLDRKSFRRASITDNGPSPRISFALDSNFKANFILPTSIFKEWVLGELMNVIETIGLTKRFKNISAVEDLSLKVGEGDLFGFLGPNGAGKTTTINMLMGFIKPTDGTAKVLGYDVRTDGKKAREKIGFLPEEFGFYDNFNAIEHLDYYGTLYGMDKRERETKIEELIKSAGLEERQESKLREYSHGMKQRLGIAQALLNDPRLLILDEPTSGLDPRATHDMRELIKGLSRRNVTLFLSSHLLYEVQQICDVVGILDRGHLIRVDKIDNLSREIGKDIGTYILVTCTNVTKEIVVAVEKVDGVLSVEQDGDKLRVKVDDVVISPEINAAIISARGRVKTIAEATPDLEDIFMRLTRG